MNISYVVARLGAFQVLDECSNVAELEDKLRLAELSPKSDTELGPECSDDGDDLTLFGKIEEEGLFYPVGGPAIGASINQFTSTSVRAAGAAEQADDAIESIPGDFDLGQVESEYTASGIDDLVLEELPLLGSRVGPRYSSGEDLALLTAASMSGLTSAETLTVASLGSGAVAGGMVLPAVDTESVLAVTSLVGSLLIGMACNERTSRLGSALVAGGFNLNST